MTPEQQEIFKQYEASIEPYLEKVIARLSLDEMQMHGEAVLTVNNLSLEFDLPLDFARQVASLGRLVGYEAVEASRKLPKLGRLASSKLEAHLRMSYVVLALSAKELNIPETRLRSAYRHSIMGGIREAADRLAEAIASELEKAAKGP